MAASKQSIADLQKELARIQAAIEERRSSAKSELRADIEQMLKDADLSLADVFPEISRGEKAAPRGRGRTRAEATPKYKDPKSGTLWSGRGRSPKWVEQILTERGISIRDFKTSGDYRA